jgi:hypothetical protein
MKTPTIVIVASWFTVIGTVVGIGALLMGVRKA